ncbi:hypothetical protein QQG74_02995 [Micromonospora sp. FIMYZ51]|uniref:hypothetical protein n=1 Tax=Micromonospora sp. FIMYZ51 TaxID=3051832 RepID=UPI00311D68AB
MTAQESEEAPLSRVRDIGSAVGRNLRERLAEIDPELLVVVASGNPDSARALSAAYAETSIPGSDLANLARWNQSSWNNAFRDTGTWTNTWGQSPPPK